MRPRSAGRPTNHSGRLAGISGARTGGCHPPLWPPVTPERTHFRDHALSLRHRQWGYDCPAVDLDFPLVEYNRGEASAIVEYKFAAAGKPDLTHPSLRALAGLANAAGIPFIVALYTREPWTFQVFRGNEHANRIYREDGRILTEREFVESLYFMRNRTLTAADEQYLAPLDRRAA